jgi:hypothetical protein
VLEQGSGLVARPASGETARFPGAAHSDTFRAWSAKACSNDPYTPISPPSFTVVGLALRPNTLSAPATAPAFLSVTTDSTPTSLVQCGFAVSPEHGPNLPFDWRLRCGRTQPLSSLLGKVMVLELDGLVQVLETSALVMGCVVGL